MIDLTEITPADFKFQFTRGFPYLPTYDPTQVYNQGDVAYYNNLFYQCNDDGTMNMAPGTSGSWTRIPDSPNNYVLDSDIQNAFNEAQMNFNQGLFGTDANILLGYLYITAHYLANDLRAAGAGLSAVGAMTMTSRSAGSISESYDIPEKYKKSSILQFYITSMYGRKYLSFIEPNMIGNVTTVQGSSGVPPYQFE